MKTILVPVDSTATTENAVLFAAQWAIKYGYDHIILMKTYGSVFGYVNISEGYTMVNEDTINSLREHTEALLDRLDHLIRSTGFTHAVSRLTSQLTLLRSINNHLNEDPTVELIILGSDDQSGDNESSVSENIISIARISRVKTLIVPEGYHFKEVKNVLIPCDISRADHLERISGYKPFLKNKNNHLMLLYIDTKGNKDARDHNKEVWENYVNNYLKDIPYSIHYSFGKEIVGGILSFAAAHQTDLIIALPGEHSFLYYMANRSISEAIYQNVGRPVLILK
ncbi:MULTISPECIES: universal stress protein [Chryseobacterium]|uniref:Nucleotide-binding universal stress UspA family protein n=1 Tax=Chryseobacterium camelliae TaxID=1265445 RepID=A0ABU0TI44_9FLAO|nr:MULTISPECIES: universal stress protein [Chryseobacterium]MDT3409484.1 nucleotide-binding universal stress UspA family protein [Pseudacidovorax intermedius]MDQ1096651.1 nucleotide-binding universal stress UspA family protein [Chryseobacterium camelliae]MDQ1100593.1 nucleotide-binding universal stress UspA family protein [Chryseobacterium sp. SORGH_AS_1048]MDR6087933.1 nucleotide-binding universal stress UspA family protein [Chryseobacterium sp. SORGH_AS_0909]MDR6132307.1 nucleotide-binding u